MKRLALLIFSSALAFAAPTLTTITDTLYTADGGTFTGTLLIQSQTFTASGSVVLQNVKTIRITAGALNTTLVPNDITSPAGTSYLFTFSSGAKLTCTIPTSSPAITLAGRCTSGTPVTPVTPVVLSLLSPNLSATSPITFSGSTGIIACPTCGSGGGTVPGLDTQVIYNNAGAFGASSSLTFSGSVIGLNSALSLGTIGSTRFYLQPQASNTQGIFGVLPNGSGTQTWLEAWNGSDLSLVNNSRMRMRANGSAGSIETNTFGSGTPITSINLSPEGTARATVDANGFGVAATSASLPVVTDANNRLRSASISTSQVAVGPALTGSSGLIYDGTNFGTAGYNIFAAGSGAGSGLLGIQPRTGTSAFVRLTPLGAGTTASIDMMNGSDLLNAGRMRFRIIGATADISSSSVGSGTAPTLLNVDFPTAALQSGAATKATVDANGFGVAATTASQIVLTDANNRLSSSATIATGSITGLAAIATSGSAADLTTGTLSAARLPALTGDVTSSAGSAATTVARINGTALSGLATGILKNTTATGVPSIAVAGTDYATGPTVITLNNTALYTVVQGSNNTTFDVTGTTATTVRLPAPGGITGPFVAVWANCTSQTLTLDATTNTATYSINGTTSTANLTVASSTSACNTLWVRKASDDTIYNLTIISAAASGSTFQNYQAGAASITANSAAYVDVYTYAAPALPAGGCWTITYNYHNAVVTGTTTARIVVDSTVIATPWVGLGSTNYYQTTINYCNQTGVQNAQYMIYTEPVMYAAGTFASSGPVFFQTPYGGGPDTTFNTPTGVDWSTGHNIKLQMNPGGTAAASAIGVFAIIYAH